MIIDHTARHRSTQAYQSVSVTFRYQDGRFGVAVTVAPTGVFYGPLVGPLGGPV